MSSGVRSALPDPGAIARSGYRTVVRRGAVRALATTGWLLLARSDLQSPATACVTESFRYNGSETFDCQPPVGVQPLPVEFETEVGTRTMPTPFVSVLHDVDLIGRWGLTVAPEQQYVVEEAEGSVGRLTDTVVRTVGHGHLPLHRGPGRASTTLPGPVASFVGRFDDEFFHWFTDYLPRVLGLEAYERRTGKKPAVLLPPDPPAWLTDSLAWAGVEDDRWMTYPGSRVHVEELVVPSMRRHAYDNAVKGWSIVSSAALRELRDRIRGAVGATPSSDERVYVSRADSDSRRVVNEEAVLDALRDHGFERHVLSEYSLTEQVELFAGADAVVGPHGAGLVNTMYGNDLTVVELFGDTVNPCYYSIATGLGCDYGYLRCEPSGADMRVDVDALEELVADLLD